jgi:AcrR family transcriptional regulator
MSSDSPQPNAKPRLGRAAQIGLTKAQIIDKAIELIDEKGFAAFSLRDLSRALKVYPSAIYWHIGGDKEQLFAEISARITAHLMSPDDACADWRDTLRLMFHRYRDTVHKHPNVAPLLGAQMRSNGMPNAQMVELTLLALEQAGYCGIGLVDAFNAVVGGFAGFVTMELASGPVGGVDSWVQNFKAQLDGLDAQAFPAMARSLELMRNKSFVLRWQNGSDVPLDGGFSCLVESLISGLEQRSPGRCSPSSLG